MQRFPTPLREQEADPGDLLIQSINACLRAKEGAGADDRFWLSMAAALLRCDLFEENEAAEAAPPVARPGSS